MEILSFGGGRRMAECRRLLDDVSVKGIGRLILLPIPTSRDEKYLTDSEIPISELSSLINGETLIVGYGIPRELLNYASDGGARLLDLSCDEDFLLENARLTANGTLGYILTNYQRDISELRIGVVGYGRIGRELTRLLLMLSSAVCVYTTRETVAMELGEMGVGCELVSADICVAPLDILINTAPARLFEEKRLPRGADIIDLASGSNFEPSERLIKLPSLPNRYYPLSSGRLYAERVRRFLKSEGRL